MNSNKRFRALILATVMGISGISISMDTVKAEEMVQKYKSVALDDSGYEINLYEEIGDEFLEKVWNENETIEEITGG